MLTDFQAQYEAALPPLERKIRDLVRRKSAAPDGSPAYKFYERVLQSLRYRYEEAGGIIEDNDPAWGVYCHRLPVRECPRGQVLRLPRRRRTSE
jgi:hypothetical protein